MFNIHWVSVCLLWMQNFIRMIQHLNNFVIVSLILLNNVFQTPSRITCLCAFALYVPYSPSCLTYLPVLGASFASRTLPAFLRWGRVHLPTHLVCLIFLSYTPYLCTLNSFKDGFTVHQKMFISQRLRKARQIVLFLCRSKKVMKNGFRWENFLSIFKTWKLLPVVLIVNLSSKSNHKTNE